MSGTYIAVRVHPESEIVIRDFMENHEIPIVYPNLERRRHVTLVSSDDDFVKEFVPKDVSYFAIPDRWEIFPTREGSRCLVLRIICPQLYDRHNEILRTYHATDRFPEYKTHISLSYDIGDYNIDGLPEFRAPIVLGDEYCEEFNMNWVKK